VSPFLHRRCIDVVLKAVGELSEMKIQQQNGTVVQHEVGMNLEKF
jgi:hypothetical protein